MKPRPFAGVQPNGSRRKLPRPRICARLAAICCALNLLRVMAGGETLAVRAYTIADGLAHNHVSSIFSDSKGFLWVCTDEGLSRFDGNRFVNYTVADGLPHIHVNTIIESRAGDYWIGTDGGLTRYRPTDPRHRFLTYTADGPHEVLFVNSVVEEQDGAILAGTAAGLYRLRLTGNQAAFDRVEFPCPPAEREAVAVNTIHLDRKGTLWLGTVRGLYRRTPDRDWLRVVLDPHGLPHDFIANIAEDPQGRIWIATRDGLGRVAENLAPTAQALDIVVTARNGLPNCDVRAIFFAADGHRWIGTASGLVEWSPGAPKASEFRNYTFRDGLLDIQTYAVAADADGNLWAGSRRGGLVRVRRAAVQTFTASEGLKFSGDDSLVETPSGEVCVAGVGDFKRAIHCFDGQRFTSTAPLLPPEVTAHPSNPREPTIIDHLGRWWISSSYGLFKFPALGARPEMHLLPNQEVRNVFEDSLGDVWFTTRSGGSFGLVRWQRATSTTHDYSADLPTIVRERGTIAFAEAPPGQLWLGLARPGGLLRLRDGRFEEIPGALVGNVEALFRDSADHLWIASGDSGVGEIARPLATPVVIRTYDRSRGLSSNEVWCITEDRYGRIYAGNARGVDRIDRAMGPVVTYSQADGLPGGDVRAALRDRRGDLWFLSIRGVSRLRPGREAAHRPPSVRIASVRIGGLAHPISDLGQGVIAPLETAWNRNSVEIEFAATDFTSPDRIRYQFRLDGASGDWSKPSPIATVYFSNLSPGNYRFLVRAMNAAAVISRTPASFDFTIPPPPWLRWPVQLVAAGVLIGLAYLWHKAQLERQVALERVRSRIATDLHDDIGATLSRVAVISEVVKNSVGVSDADALRRLTELAETSRALVGNMSDIVWSIDARRDNIGDVMARLRAFGSDVLESRGIGWTCEASFRVRLLPEQRWEFYLIFKEAITNAGRHSQARNVVLRVDLRDGRLCGELSDDGRGVSDCGVGGIGIRSMRERAVRLGGRFWIDSRPEGGTIVRLELPLRASKQHDHALARRRST